MISSHSGLVLLNKPSGITSFRVLNILKKKLDTGKVGHTGTLDKFAEGLMLVLTGRMTKLAPFFSNMDKEYQAVYKFGEETNTLDPEGEITATADVPDISVIEKNLDSFIGRIMQRPPDFSAIHLNGRRAYKIALSGEKPDIPERPVTVYDYKIKEWNPPYLTVKVKCSKGTYIRSMARDLGEACGSKAYISYLSRITVGTWNLIDSILPEYFDPEKNIISGIDLFKKIPSISVVSVNDSQAEMILKGVSISRWNQKDINLLKDNTAVFDERENFLALIENKNNILNYRFVQDRS